MANGATLGGHIIIEDNAILGGLVGVHQFAHIGSYAMVGGLTGVSKDVPSIYYCCRRKSQAPWSQPHRT